MVLIRRSQHQMQGQKFVADETYEGNDREVWPRKCKFRLRKIGILAMIKLKSDLINRIKCKDLSGIVKQG